MLNVVLLVYVITLVASVVIVVFIARTEHLALLDICFAVLWGVLPVANLSLLMILIHLLRHSSDPAYHFDFTQQDNR